MKITEYPQVSSLTTDNVFLLDGPNGTKQINGEDFPYAMMNLMGPEMHRVVFRGKNLGSSFTPTQMAAIRSGTFTDLWLGDYWTFGDVRYRIWDFDYWYNCGDAAFTNHHLVIMPDSGLYSAKMNDSDITTGAYYGSAMYRNNLTTAKNIIQSNFGTSGILTHRDFLQTAVAANGRPSNGGWYQSSIELPNEYMIYGNSHFIPAHDGSSTVSILHTINKVQLALGAIVPKFINTRQAYWLRDVISSAGFASVDAYGRASCSTASNELQVRPVFPIG